MPDDAQEPDAHEPDAHEPDAHEPDAQLSDAVEDALQPATHDSVMAIWQQVVLGRLDGGNPQQDEETREALRRLYGQDRDD